MSNDWIEWGGGECPVDELAKVRLLFRGEEVSESPEIGTPAGYLEWDHQGGGGDIVAYRVVEQPGASTTALTQQHGGTHYRDCKIQPVEFIEANRLGFLEGSIIKRATRHGHATGKGAEDIRKIIHEAQLLLELRYGGEAA